MCDKAVDDCLGALKIISNRLVTSKMLEMFHDDLLANDDVFFSDKNFSKVTLFANEMGIPGVDIDKVNLDNDNNFEKDDPEIITSVRLLACHHKLEKRKALGKGLSKELMPVVWHATILGDWWLPKNEKKE